LLQLTARCTDIGGRPTPFSARPSATEFLLASMAHEIGPWLSRAGRRFSQAGGGVFIMIDVALPIRV
jgi:hypothetical protein